EILALPADDPRRKAHIAKLVGYHKKSGDQLLLERMSADSKYTGRPKQFDDNSEDPPDETAESNRQIVTRLGKQPRLEDVSEQERIAALQCLVMLSVKEDGTLPDNGVIGSREITIPEHKGKVPVSATERAGNQSKVTEKWETRPAETVKQEIT